MERGCASVWMVVEAQSSWLTMQGEPGVVLSAVAAVETKMWRQTSNRYHQFIEDSANTMSGSLHCSDTVREALEE